jgi:DNA-binding NarL/FixJ family response regulator
MNRTHVLVADGLAIFRCALRAVLARERDFEVVEAGGLEQMLAALRETCPDVALIDLDLPPRGGISAVAQLSEHCSCCTIVWSFDPSAETVLEAIRAGADGYIDKRISSEGLVRALRGVQRGEAALSRDLTAGMIEALHGRDVGDRARERVARLSAREREVLDLVGAGARNKQIATELVISEFTVKRHMQNILQKLELPTRREAAAFLGTVETV